MDEQVTKRRHVISHFESYEIYEWSSQGLVETLPAWPMSRLELLWA